MPVVQEGETVSKINRELQAGNTRLDGVECDCGRLGTLRYAMFSSTEQGKTKKSHFVHCCSCAKQYVMLTR
jgi:hypothetical protein